MLVGVCPTILCSMYMSGNEPFWSALNQTDILMIFSESLAIVPEGLKVGQKCTKNHAKNEEAISLLLLLVYFFFAELLGSYIFL